MDEFGPCVLSIKKTVHLPFRSPFEPRNRRSPFELPAAAKVRHVRLAGPRATWTQGGNSLIETHRATVLFVRLHLFLTRYS